MMLINILNSTILVQVYYKVYSILLGGPLFTSNNFVTVRYKFLINIINRRLKMHMYVSCIYYKFFL